MPQSKTLTKVPEQGKVALVEVSEPSGVAHLHRGATAAEVLLADGRHRRESRLSASLSPQAAAVLPVMLALARLQARRSSERGA